MPSGVPFERQFIYVMKDGSAVIDWGDELVQDLISGEFIKPNKSDYSHPIQDEELEMLRRAGRVERFDARQVLIYSLPERPQKTIE